MDSSNGQNECPHQAKMSLGQFCFSDADTFIFFCNLAVLMADYIRIRRSSKIYRQIYDFRAPPSVTEMRGGRRLGARLDRFSVALFN
jgi:hypothetical protein